MTKLVRVITILVRKVAKLVGVESIPIGIGSFLSNFIFQKLLFFISQSWLEVFDARYSDEKRLNQTL